MQPANFGSDDASTRSVTGPDPARARRLAEIRAMIDAGTYDTADRWDAALSRLFTTVGDCD